MNQLNCFIFISVYFKTCYSKNHVKKVARALKVIIWSLGSLMTSFVTKGAVNDDLFYSKVKFKGATKL